MEKFILVIYEFLANILTYVAFFPSGVTVEGDGILVGIAILGGVISIVMMLSAIYSNQGSYNFPVKLAIGGAWVLIITHFAVLKLSGLDTAGYVSQTERLAAIILLVIAVGFAAVNFLLDFRMGKICVTLWLGEFLFAASTVRLWNYIKGSEGIPEHDKLMLMSKAVNPVASFMEKLGLQGLTGVFESVLLIVLMFVTVFYLFRTKRFIPKEWGICVTAQMLAGISYMLYEVHDGIAWRMDQAFMVFLLFCTGWMIYLVIFIYEIGSKDQKGCIGAFFIGVSGIFWSLAVVFSADIAKRGALSKNLKRISDIMKKVYHFMPFGRHSDLKEGNAALPVFGFLITIALAVLLLLILFAVLGKVLKYNEEENGMSAGWFRNCSMVLIVPIIVYWNCSMFGNIFKDSYSWVMLMVQAFTGIGMALCISNIAPAFHKGFLKQIKLIVVSTVSSLFVSIVLVPVIFALL